MTENNTGFIPRGVWLIPLLILGFIIVILGTGTIYGLIKLFTSPVITGQIPVWTIFVVIILYLMIRRR